MLQIIRSKASSFVVKILFGLLIVTFGLWGIGDIFRNRGVSTDVATVGDLSISIDELNKTAQRDIERLRTTFGGSLDAQQIKDLGVVDQALQRLITQDLVALEIRRMRLDIGDQAVRDAIVGNSAFRNQAGAFDRNVYNAVLQANGLSDPQFEALQRSDLLRAQLMSALVGGMTPPKELVNALYRARAERRVADIATLPPSAAGTIPAPGEAALDTYYRAHQDSFKAPERRDFEVAMLRLEDIAKTIPVSEDDLAKEFKQRQEQFRTPEERQVQQMLLPDEATAKAAAAALVQGKSFATVARDVAKMTDPGALDLGWVKRDDLPKELADAAFAVKDGEVTQPVKSSFGWHILRVQAIKPAKAQSFADAKAKLTHMIALDRASDRMADIANHIDDAMAGGARFEDVVRKFELKAVTATGIDAQGKDPTGKALDLPSNADAVLKTAFATDSGKTSILSEMGEDGYYIVKVDAVMPAAVRPLADVRDQAVKLWQDEARQKALEKLAQDIVREVEAGKSLKDVAAAHHLALTTTAPMQRDSNDKSVAPTLLAEIFDAKKGAVVSASYADSVYVAQVDSIEPADPSKDASAVNALTQQLGAVMQADVVSEYEQALRRTFPVEIDKSNLDRML
jgi:peptidyl-prolyl cis-trans isomerase D